MNKEILDKYLKAGKIAAQARDYGCGLVKTGVKLAEIAEEVEEKIKKLGGEIAFPINISVNENAAHYTPTLKDKAVVEEKDYVKIDVGAHVDGYIGDTALTVRLAGRDKLIECSEKMLANAIKVVKPGVTIMEIGEVIENTAKEFGFNPVRNLTGHGLGRFNLHAGSVIPNIKTDNMFALREGEVYAIEPFCTAGNGMVKDSEPALIFRWVGDQSVRSAEARKILEWGKGKFNKLPFAKRWLEKSISPFKLELALKQLSTVRAIYPYKILKEVSNSPVAQAEHTVIVKKKPIVTTKL